MADVTFEIVRAASQTHFAAARRLFEAYADWLAIDLCFQHFDEELNTLSMIYGPPSGRLLLAQAGETWAGCVGVRDLGDGMCEMRRLYVLPACRGHGIGRALAAASVEAAQALGYTTMRLDTLETMQAARVLYRTLGFYERSAYYANPNAGVVYMERML